MALFKGLAAVHVAVTGRPLTVDVDTVQGRVTIIDPIPGRAGSAAALDRPVDQQG